MTALGNVLLGIAIVSALVGVASSLALAAELQRRGAKIDCIWFRVLIVARYLGQYRDITRRETGRTGPWFRAYATCMIVALVTAIAGLVLRAL